MEKLDNVLKLPVDSSCTSAVSISYNMSIKDLLTVGTGNKVGLLVM